VSVKGPQNHYVLINLEEEEEEEEKGGFIY
jgi:hypothetical protein